MDEENESESAEVALDAAQLEKLQMHLMDQQNFPLGFTAGFVAMLVGAVAWAVVTVITEYQIGWMAIGVGFLVGLAVSFGGKGQSQIFGFSGALLALAGCLLGNILTICGFAAQDPETTILGAFFTLMLDPALLYSVLQESFSYMDLLFYGIAVYTGYKVSFYTLTSDDIAAVQ